MSEANQIVERIVMPNRADFEKAMAEIGWVVQKSWNGLNDKLFTPSGNFSGWRVEYDKLSPFDTTVLSGGEPFLCSIVVSFKDMEILNDRTVCLGQGGVFVLFHKA